MPGILGKKIGMTRIFTEEGRSVAVTVLECQPSTIIQVKTAEKDGYNAIVVGFDAYKRPSKNKKYKTVKEFRVDSTETYAIGDSVSVESLCKEGDIKSVKLTGNARGFGFQGVIKRYNFSRGPETHGSHHHREPGSIGACAMPGRVAKGKKLPGRMGNQQVTKRNVPVVVVDKQKHLIAVKGSVPGAFNSVIQLFVEA